MATYWVRMQDWISIHAPREGSDHKAAQKEGREERFLSTLPARGATWQIVLVIGQSNISIHAPREGSDPAGSGTGLGHHHFYPRSPRGERLLVCCGRGTGGSFLSTLPARGATVRCGLPMYAEEFLSTLPARGATFLQLPALVHRVRISIHAPREGSDLLALRPTQPHQISIHAPREGSDHR